MFAPIADAIIREAMDRGEFACLRGAGGPIDLRGYFETPEDLRIAYSVLKTAGLPPPEVGLMQEAAILQEKARTEMRAPEPRHIQRLIQHTNLKIAILREARGRADHCGARATEGD